MDWVTGITARSSAGSSLRLPILIDRLQGHGAHSTNLMNPRIKWILPENGRPTKTANHAGQRGIPDGGNFLFEDGHVQWIQSRNVTLGSSQSQWQCFYGIRLP